MLLTACLTWALLYTAECLRCHQCVDQACTNTTSILCPAISQVCRTATSVLQEGSTTTSRVEKSCSTNTLCTTPHLLEAELSVNRGTSRQAITQICCVEDNCNFQTLAVPSTAVNGKLCPSCSSVVDSQAGRCNLVVSCVGVENSCFNATGLLHGCVSRNLCLDMAAQAILLGTGATVTCNAPWIIRVSAAMLTSSLTAWKVLV